LLVGSCAECLSASRNHLTVKLIISNQPPSIPRTEGEVHWRMNARNGCFLSVIFNYILLLSHLLHFASSNIDLTTIRNDEIAILQYDSRKPRDYWLAAAQWNHAYCAKHGHIYIYYSTREGCHYSDEKLATPWCKVKAMLAANDDFPRIKFFIYMDSDAVIDRLFADRPLNEMIGTMQQKLSWDPDAKPIIFNQDGPCWWCDLIKKKGYYMCLNAGTVAWYRHELSEKILKDWWDASMDSYETQNPIKRRFRIKWPWEQDRQMAVYNRSAHLIQVASQPERPHMIHRAGLSDTVGWCLSHLPGSGCFISHFCQNSNAKQRMKKLYRTTQSTVGGNILSAEIHSDDLSYFNFTITFLKFP